MDISLAKQRLEILMPKVASYEAKRDFKQQELTKNINKINELVKSNQFIDLVNNFDFITESEITILLTEVTTDNISLFIDTLNSVGEKVGEEIQKIDDWYSYNG